MKLKQIFVLMAMIFSLGAFAQGGGGGAQSSGGGGNGGDYIRMKFMEIGNFILQNYKGGLKDIESLATIEALRSTLNIRVIKLSANQLTDNGGSKVDALGSVGSITLFEGDKLAGSGWYGIFEKADLVEKLVLHEMLRAAGVNDDNYVYSTLALSKYDLNNFDKSAYLRWCSESASFIESALKQGLLARTVDQELDIYSKALDQVQGLISPKHFYFIAPSVVGTKKVVAAFKTNKNRVNFLKVALKQIAGDIRYVDSQIQGNNSANRKVIGDNSKYAASYLESATRFTIYAETAEIEVKIFDIVLDQAYAYMVNSDYARVKYGQFFSEVDSARNTPVLGYKRQAVRTLSNLLK